MKRLLVAFILLLNLVARADTPAVVRIRVKLPFEPDSPGAVVLPVGTRVTVLWPQDGKLMVRYRRVEGLVPAVTIDYVPSQHPEDVRQYRPEPVAKEEEAPSARTERAPNTYHAPAATETGGGTASSLGSLPLSKIGIGAGVVLMVLIASSMGRGKETNDGPLLRRQS